MKKRLSFSQLTVLSLALIPTQQAFASSPTESAKKTEAAPVAPAVSTQQSSAGWLSVFGFGSSNAQQHSETEQLDAYILTLANSGKLYDSKSTSINPELLKKCAKETLAGIFAKLARLNGDESSAALEKMQADITARQKDFEIEYTKKTKTLEQLLQAATATEIAGPALFRNTQAQRKAHEASINQLILALLNFGYAFSNNSKDARDLMDTALHSAKGTMTEIKRSVSPKHKNVPQYAGLILGVKKDSTKTEQPK